MEGSKHTVFRITDWFGDVSVLSMNFGIVLETEYLDVIITKQKNEISELRDTVRKLEDRLLFLECYPGIGPVYKEGLKEVEKIIQETNDQSSQSPILKEYKQ